MESTSSAPSTGKTTMNAIAVAEGVTLSITGKTSDSLLLPQKTLWVQRSANVFLKGQINNKYFRLCRPPGLCCTYSILPCSLKAALDDTWTNRCNYVPIKFYLQQQAAGQIWHMGQVVYPTLYNCMCYLRVISIYLHGWCKCYQIKKMLLLHIVTGTSFFFLFAVLVSVTDLVVLWTKKVTEIQRVYQKPQESITMAQFWYRC